VVASSASSARTLDERVGWEVCSGHVGQSARDGKGARSTTHDSFEQRSTMTEAADNSPPTSPYATHVDIRYEPLTLVDIQRLVDACTDQWYNQTLCRVNDSVVRLGVMQGEYHWHKHDHDDEFFYVIEGRFFIDLDDRTVELAPRQGFVVPRGVVHRTRAPERTVILMVENAGIVPTGD
jgi:mannose-6-phosphate isomerase-like protein (cupin superfamily)